MTKVRLPPQEREDPDWNKFISEGAAFGCDNYWFTGITMNPEKTVQELMSERPTAAQLTFGAEIVGRYGASDLVVQPLLTLLKHESAVVREGVVLGLYAHRAIKEVTEALVKVSKEDSSPGVRQTAEDCLTD